MLEILHRIVMNVWCVKWRKFLVWCKTRKAINNFNNNNPVRTLEKLKKNRSGEMNARECEEWSREIYNLFFKQSQRHKDDEKSYFGESSLQHQQFSKFFHT